MFEWIYTKWDMMHRQMSKDATNILSAASLLPNRKLNIFRVIRRRNCDWYVICTKGRWSLEISSVIRKAQLVAPLNQSCFTC